MAVTTEPPWLNKTSGTAARNGTVTHTIPFGFTSTSGSLLVFIIYGSVTHTEGGGTWTERLEPVNNGELSFFTKTSTGDSSITITHNGSNYPAPWACYEFPAGSTYTSGTSTNATTSDTFPALGSLPGTAQLIIAARGRPVAGSAATAAASTWTAPWVEDADIFSAFATTDAGYLTVGHQINVTATSITPAAATTYNGGGADTGFSADRQHIVAAINAAAVVSSPAPATVPVTTTIATPTKVGQVNIPATVPVTTSIPAPTTVGQLNRPVTVAVTTSIPAPAGRGPANPATVQLTTSIPGPVVGGTPPTVTAGRARPVVAGQGVQLDVAATPPGGESIIGYAWSIVSGGGSLTGASTATPTWTAPGSGSGTAVIRAAVSATNAGLATADVTVSYAANIVAAENALTGTARATWDLSSPNLGGVATLQGFCDGFTINKGDTANFKITQSDTAGWTAAVYRLGYYSGDGARLYANLTPSGGQVTASQGQPSPADADPDTTLLSADCAAWSTTLTWAPPAWAPSGIYVLRLNRTGGGASHIMFVVRDDARAADLMLMPADSTWNAYNAWGGMGSDQYTGNSLYYGTLLDQYNSDCAHYVSYNRPVVNRGAADSGRSYGAVEWSNFFTGEYGMLRFVERNGIDVKYYGCIDAGADSLGVHLLGDGSTYGGVKAGMFVGHNEYWSDVMRAGWERAKNRGVSVFSCASNEVFWRTVGTQADSAGRPRLVECQKSTINGRGSTRPQWTGTWRDPDGAGKGGNNPENTFTGTIFMVNGPDLRSLVVPFTGGYSAQPLWRHTSVAALASGSFSSPGEILGFEWDTYGAGGASTTGNAFLAAAHPRARYCSDVTYTVANIVLTDAGDVYGTGDVTHRLVVHPGGAGAVCFATGTINWALGVDDANTWQIGSDNTSGPIQQATVNMLADMGAAAATLMGTLTAPTPVDWYPDVPVATVLVTTTIATPLVQNSASPATVPVTTSIPGPAVQAGAGPAPATVTIATSIPAAAGQGGTVAAPATVQLTTSIPAAAVQLSAVPAPATVAVPTTIPAAAFTSPSGAAPATVQVTTSIPGPAVQGNAVAAPATVQLTTSIPAAAGQGGAAAVPATVAVSTSIPAASVQLPAVPAPATIAVTTSISGFAGSATIIAVATVQATTSIATAEPAAGAAPAPATVAVTTSIAVPEVSAGSSATPEPATVPVSTSIPAAAVTVVSAAQPATIGVVTIIGVAAVLAGIRAAVATVPVTTSIPGPQVSGDQSAGITAATVHVTTVIGAATPVGPAPQVIAYPHRVSMTTSPASVRRSI